MSKPLPPEPTEPRLKVTRLRRTKAAVPPDAEPEALPPAVAIERMAGCGLDAHAIGHVLGLKTEQVEKHYGDALRAGVAKANFKVADALFRMATDPNHRASGICAIYWTKARMGWRDGSGPEEALPPAGPGADASHITDPDCRARFAEVMATLRRAAS